MTDRLWPPDSLTALAKLLCVIAVQFILLPVGILIRVYDTLDALADYIWGRGCEEGRQP